MCNYIVFPCCNLPSLIYVVSNVLFFLQWDALAHWAFILFLVFFQNGYAACDQVIVEDYYSEEDNEAAVGVAGDGVNAPPPTGLLLLEWRNTAGIIISFFHPNFMQNLYTFLFFL